ncbi:MAG: hypothetical protein OXF07_11350 [Rhodobacter sp.]|nr:hypothetical protein [Rhodobacter sp.]MCY4166918.1 hypothetical protein [Rhodobacter sp.]MCY4240633.1 hypothetical protein [Rhodobacter sp.]
MATPPIDGGIYRDPLPDSGIHSLLTDVPGIRTMPQVAGELAAARTAFGPISEVSARAILDASRNAAIAPRELAAETGRSAEGSEEIARNSAANRRPVS